MNQHVPDRRVVNKHRTTLDHTRAKSADSVLFGIKVHK